VDSNQRPLAPKPAHLMNTHLLPRTQLVRLLLATALTGMAVSSLGGVISLATWPALDVIQNRINPLLGVATAVTSALTIGLLLWSLRLARARAMADPSSIWGQNASLLDVAWFVMLVYLAEVVIWLVAREVRGFVEISMGNALQIDMFSPVARFCFVVVVPAVGIVILLRVAPRFLRDDPPEPRDPSPEPQLNS
jgi:hypothetical protein